MYDCGMVFGAGLSISKTAKPYLQCTKNGLKNNKTIWRKTFLWAEGKGRQSLTQGSLGLKQKKS